MRIQVNLSDEMVARVDKYAEMLGVSRSALCSVFVGQGVMGYDQAFKIVSNASVNVMQNDVTLDGQVELEDILKTSKESTAKKFKRRS